MYDNSIEAPLNFKPTYKYDVGTDVYDTSSKGRIPSWTDRILYVPRPGVQCLAYNADESVKTSDHRPVYASFSVDIELPAAVVATYATDAPTVQSGAGASAGTANATSANGGSADGNVVQVQNISNMTTAEHKKLPEFTSESQVCTIM